MKTKNLVSIALWIAVFLLLVVFVGKTNRADTFKISPHDPVIGSEKAPLTIVMYGSYECSVSKAFFEEIYPKLKADFIDSGKVRFVYKNHYSSVDMSHATAAEAALCANGRGKFWDYNKILFDNKDKWSPVLGISSMTEVFDPIFNRYAEEIGLDQAAFLECLFGYQYKQNIIDDYINARELGIEKTPSYILNGFVINGMPSVKDFDMLVSKFNLG